MRKWRGMCITIEENDKRDHSSVAVWMKLGHAIEYIKLCRRILDECDLCSIYIFTIAKSGFRLQRVHLNIYRSRLRV